MLISWRYKINQIKSNLISVFCTGNIFLRDVLLFNFFVVVMLELDCFQLFQCSSLCSLYLWFTIEQFHTAAKVHNQALFISFPFSHQVVEVVAMTGTDLVMMTDMVGEVGSLDLFKV